LAGVILSISPYATEISSKIRPLRDFFLILFFIILGLKVQISDFGKIILNALILSGITLLIKPLIIWGAMKGLRYTKRTRFIVSSTMGQISEFSVIILGIGAALGHVLPSDLNTIVLTLVITILISSYFITYSERIYTKITKWTPFFKDKKKIKKKSEENYHIILFGYNRIGYSILNSLKKLKKKYLVIDYNPDTISQLKKIGVPALYGDVYDLDLLEDLPLEKLEMAISTIPEVETNKLLIQTIREYNSKAIVILRAHTIKDALDLYNMGASYVLTPHFLGGEYVAKMVKHLKPKDRDYNLERKKHIETLKEMFKMGKEHPEIEKD
jgi:FlaA1/EpsC-like NDP-sugar epimerase